MILVLYIFLQNTSVYFYIVKEVLLGVLEISLIIILSFHQLHYRIFFISPFQLLKLFFVLLLRPTSCGNHSLVFLIVSICGFIFNYVKNNINLFCINVFSLVIGSIKIIFQEYISLYVVLFSTMYVFSLVIGSIKMFIFPRLFFFAKIQSSL